jgi:hypothetical protein
MNIPEGITDQVRPGFHNLPMKLFGGDLFKVPTDYAEIFARKGVRTVALSIGGSASSLPELEMAEDLGCPIHIAPLSENQRAAWSAAVDVVKTKTVDEASPHAAFLKGGDSKWVIPTNLRLKAAVPWWSAGTVGSVVAAPAHEFMEEICTGLRIPADQARLDILKIDTVSHAPGLERGIISAIIDAGFRPAYIFVRWSESPDETTSAAFAAGHLQNSGYRLLSVRPDNHFVYYFTDSDLYQICSWTNTRVANPMVEELAASLRASFAPSPK